MRAPRSGGSPHPDAFTMATYERHPPKRAARGARCSGSVGRRPWAPCAVIDADPPAPRSSSSGSQIHSRPIPAGRKPGFRSRALRGLGYGKGVPAPRPGGERPMTRRGNGPRPPLRAAALPGAAAAARSIRAGGTGLGSRPEVGGSRHAKRPLEPAGPMDRTHIVPATRGGGGRGRLRRPSPRVPARPLALCPCGRPARTGAPTRACQRATGHAPRHAERARAPTIP